ncbi:T9SS type A sorting domain-containing protein [Flavivirga sp. 57AJ16]|uniref:T9SS type A sorting domain-containing protein n=1 Tax=Flavivirga sp. 57AJ16 TaxID=3025307 RepID=UPI0023662167|nr:T9SS type A sorting domain-containing protein [Flavivirga sp. 57AJ16]MDD7887513.1 T9SS type A sorting domain-containing protein [Flavivirga sp. 57AJ16]
MKTKLLFCVIVLISAIVLSQTTVSIPDDAFEAYLETQFVSNITPDGDTTDGFITFTDINLITDIDLPGASVTTVADLSGVNQFPKLKNLYCQNNAIIGEIDLSGLDLLTNFYCYGNSGLTSLNFSGCTKLYHVKAYECGLTSLDLSNATLNAGADPTRLRYVYVQNNGLTNIDISGNTGIFRLDVYENQLTSIDISDLTTLTYLRFQNNNVTGDLDVSANLGLEKLGAYENDLSSIDLGSIPYTVFTYFKISSNPSLTCVYTDNPSHFEPGGDLETALGSNYSVNGTTNFVVDADACAAILSVTSNHFPNLHVFPNPFNMELNIHTLNQVNYKLFNLSGQMVYSGKVDMANHEIDLSNLTNGIYHLQFKDEEGHMLVKKLIKQ